MPTEADCAEDYQVPYALASEAASAIGGAALQALLARVRDGARFRGAVTASGGAGG